MTMGVAVLSGLHLMDHNRSPLSNSTNFLSFTHGNSATGYCSKFTNTGPNFNKAHIFFFFNQDKTRGTNGPTDIARTDKKQKPLKEIWLVVAYELKYS
jgi:hypothetical protein